MECYHFTAFAKEASRIGRGQRLPVGSVVSVFCEAYPCGAEGAAEVPPTALGALLPTAPVASKASTRVLR